MLRLPRSLQGRLLALVLGTTLCVWIATAALTWRDARHEIDELLDGHLAQAAALLVAQQAGEGGDDERVDAPILHRYAPRVVFQVFHEGRLAMRSANAPAQPMVAAHDGAVLQGFHTVRLDGRDWRVFATHGAERDVQVFVGEAERARDSILWAVLRSTLWPLAVALPLLALAGWWGVHRGVEPLRALGRTLAQRQAGDLRPVRVDGAPAEMQPMLDALDGLFARIASLLEGERRFTADAAHELRTPIAAIRAQAEVALAAQGEGQRRALKRTLAGCDRATRLVDQLLTLSRLDAETPLPDDVPDLAALVQRELAALAPSALARRQELVFDSTGDCEVAGDETLLAVLARNLVDNALLYSPAGAHVAVQVRRMKDDVELCVEDSGPGLAADDLARLGQRFFRVAGNEAAGSGLGWSIVQRIAAAHGATLQADRSPRLGGLRVRARFPGAPAATVRK